MLLFLELWYEHDTLVFSKNTENELVFFLKIIKFTTNQDQQNNLETLDLLIP